MHGLISIFCKTTKTVKCVIEFSVDADNIHVIILPLAIPVKLHSTN